ncbi:MULTISPECIES: NAD-dependent protein deacetylase [Xanthomonas]|uniref:NAD-dependent protein deacetylase n=1 Tax=Xanthomonas cucurbitae TaxID=56453 RepID=A0A2S7DTJ5_9XANT|nr:NAD-dependent protein deacetylase [Xanthomonas cucurbitae]PPU77090.1 NAD-dependent deacetylase [Xanthomonas cucurbitae]QHG85864.1 NAD-dependent protein deacetylase [Xanthomonas cucurbitae]WDM67377.1 NAD-dependent protein deacetylase [Xanthomonas cucurbitae]WDM71254.1 NAD-dependent protein deacetylase [Xanthomonas cucurbitae]WDM75764.1 NAD-dependent protein deacetylase [Xanthomonas cucurbitae]
MTAAPAQADDALQAFIQRHQRLFVLSGAGCSTDSGIPDYRDLQGGWKRPQPVTFQAFMGELSTRQRYWARSLVGWPRFGLAKPNATHHALAALEARGQLELLLTQNVDRLHQAAGSLAVIDLHGRLDVVRCMGCERRLPRTEFQLLLEQANPGWAELDAAQAPDGDADLDDVAFDRFVVPPCPVCGGVLKPDVVFFGENVPRERVERAFAHLQAADAVLVVGSSLMVYSGFRFVQAAARNGVPIAALNFGRTRADALLSLKVERSCADALAFLQPSPDPLHTVAASDASARCA